LSKPPAPAEEPEIETVVHNRRGVTSLWFRYGYIANAVKIGVDTTELPEEKNLPPPAH
jgi:hypothetical protein